MDTESATLIAVASVQALAMIVLVLVTLTYARSSQRQAEAAIETARLTRESVLNAFRPVLTVKPVPYRQGEVPYVALRLVNGGLGRAVITEAACSMGPRLFQRTPPSVFIDVGGHTEAHFDLPATGPYGGVVATIDYRDVFNRTFRTTHKFRLDPGDNGNLNYAFEGEEQELIEEGPSAKAVRFIVAGGAVESLS